MSLCIKNNNVSRSGALATLRDAIAHNSDMGSGRTGCLQVSCASFRPLPQIEVEDLRPILERDHWLTGIEQHRRHKYELCAIRSCRGQVEPPCK